jgi:hypothetical protein
LFAPFILAVTLPACGGSIASKNLPAAAKGDDRIPSGLLVASSKTINFGTVRQRGQKQAEVVFSNPTLTTVNVANIWSSCPCLEVELSPSKVGPSETASARINLNLAEEPDFTGHLRMQVEGRTTEGRLAVSLEIRVTVSPIGKNP